MKVNENLLNIYSKDTIKDSKLMQRYIAWFDSLQSYPVLAYFTNEDIQYLHKLATSPSYHCNVKELYREMDELMKRRNFKLIGGGTNRRAYECIYNKNIIAKVGTDYVGFVSNKKEFVNQNVLKPFCNKIFDVSPCGTIAIIEAVVPLKDTSEFEKYSEEIFDILYFKIRANDICMDDIGTRSFKNWGYRPGFGPVLLDYPSMYVADPKKNKCRDIINGKLCCGLIDYDAGYNNIVCSECGRTYPASTLSLPEGEELNSLLAAVGYTTTTKVKGNRKMKIFITNAETNEIVDEIESSSRSTYVDPSINFKWPDKPIVKPQIKKRKSINIFITPLNDDQQSDIKENQSAKETEPTVISKPKETVLVTTEVSTDKKSEFMRIFDLMNSGLEFEEAVDSKKIPINKLMESVNNMIIPNDPVITREESNGLYRIVQLATISDFLDNKPIYIDNNNIALLDSDLNDALKKISGINDNSKMPEVFHKLLLYVKNTKIFFECIFNFWITLMRLYCLDKKEKEGEDRKIYYINTDMYNTVFKDTIKTALHDYRYNIALSGLSYNTKNIYNAIATAVSNIDDSKYNNSDSIYCFDLNTDYAVITKQVKEEESQSDNAEHGKTNSEEQSISINNDEQESESSVDNEPIKTEVLTPVQQYEVFSNNNPVKQGTRKQQQRYGGKKKKRNRR